MTAKDIGVLIAIPPDLKEWVDAQAEDIGLNAALWIRMLVFQARKKHLAPMLQAAQPHVIPQFTIIPDTPAASPTVDPDAWRGSPEDEPTESSGVDIDAMIDSRVAEAESAGLTQPPPQPYEAFGPPMAGSAPWNAAPSTNVRSLRRPPPQYSPAVQPGHLRNL